MTPLQALAYAFYLCLISVWLGTGTAASIKAWNGDASPFVLWLIGCSGVLALWRLRETRVRNSFTEEPSCSDRSTPN